MPLSKLRALINKDLEATDALIRDKLHSNVPFIDELANYIIESGGKRVRPLLALLTAKTFGYQGADHIALAAIIEFIHTATLLHDDVVDASELRRGRKTANAIWGNEASVLVGDFLYSRAFQMMTDLNDMRVMRILSDATNCIAEGEVLQLINCGNTQITVEDYYTVIQQKTAKLFEAASQLGATLNNCPENEIHAMQQYGIHIGTAFQLVDDALDYHGSSDNIGKNLGDDLAEGKPTLPLIYILQNGSKQHSDLVREAIEAENHADYLPQIQAAVESTGAIAYTVDAAKQQAQSAIGAIADIPPSHYRDALIDLAHFTVARTQ